MSKSVRPTPLPLHNSTSHPENINSTVIADQGTNALNHDHGKELARMTDSTAILPHAKKYRSCILCSEIAGAKLAAVWLKLKPVIAFKYFFSITMLITFCLK